MAIPKAPASTGPDLEWRDGAPVSARFGDSYFSREGGLEESRAVFLQGCGLPHAWADRALFRVGELGFGTGLNALALWDCWRAHRPPAARLVMVSVEAFPLPLEDAARAHAAFPELAELSARLRAQWPAAAPGPHLLDFPEDGFSLTVFHDEAGAALSQIEGAFDSWFLDGFAPARNPEMWRPDLLACIAALSAPGARASTFTVAGAVRRGLTDAGFAVEKRPGFGRKRERLEAILHRLPASITGPDPLPRGAPAPGAVLVLGGGIAGCAMAHALRARGRDATIVTHGPPASAPPAALLTPRLEAADRPHARALAAAFLHAANLYAALDAFDTRGGTRLGLDPARASSLAGLWPHLAAQDGALAMELAGTLDPSRALAALAGAAKRVEAHAARIARQDGRWVLFDAQGETIAVAPVLVLCGGAAGVGQDLLAPLTLSLSAGQVSLHHAAHPPQGLVAWGGFAAPINPKDGGGNIMIGATHDAVPDAAPPAPDAARAAVLAMEAEAKLAIGLDPDPLHIWTGVRAVTPDRLPCAGPVPDPESYRAHFADFAKGRRASSDADGADAFLPGLFTLTGLGSRGFAHAPLLAQSVAAEICGEPSPLAADGRRALHPARFLLRALKRE